MIARFKRRGADVSAEFEASLHDLSVQLESSIRHQDLDGLKQLYACCRSLQAERQQWQVRNHRLVDQHWGEELIEKIQACITRAGDW